MTIIDLTEYRIAEVVECLPPEGDYRLITFSWVDDEGIFQRWFPLLYQHFHVHECPKLGQKLPWEKIEEITEEV